MENIKINYGNSYVSNQLNGSSFNIIFISNNLSDDNIFLNTNNGIIEIKNNLNIGIYNIKINYINDGILIDKIYNITVLPNFFYDLSNLNNNSLLKPILHPNNINGLFLFDYKNDDIIIDSTSGIIKLNNIDIGNYLFTVNWIINEVEVSQLISFTIKPIFYYEDNNKIIYYGNNIYSNKPLIEPLITDYIILSDYKINNEGILDLSFYDVGEYKIKVLLKTKNITVETYYNLYVKSSINYLNTEYICDSLTDYIINNPIVSQVGGIYSLLDNYNNYFSINENNGEILINGPSGIYELKIKYTKNNAYDKCILKIIINPVFSYSNLVINTNDILEIKPYTNEIIEGEFILLNNINGLSIHKNTGIISINKLYPNTYNILINYIKNGCTKNSKFKLEVFPVLLLNQNKFTIYPITDNYILLSDNKNVKILNNTINCDDIILIGNYNITITLTINNMSTNIIYNYIKYPEIIYDDFVFYGNFNEPFISSKPNNSYIGGLYKLENNKFIIDEELGIIYGNNLEVNEYELDIHLIYLSFDVIKKIRVIIKPLLKIEKINFIYSEFKIENINFLPFNGIFTVNDEDYNDLSFELLFNKLDVGKYNIDIGYTVNNIKSIVNVPIEINKKKLELDLIIKDKEFDNNNDVEIICNNYSEILVYGNYENINVGNNKIIIKNILLPESLANNYYVDLKFIYGNILPKIIYPNITIDDKYFDNTIISKVNFDIDIESYEAIYESKNIGNHIVTIKNIKFNKKNHILLYNEYKLVGNILPKLIKVYCSAKDKIYNNSDNCEVIIDKIDGIIVNDKIFINIITAKFDDKNVGLYNVKIIDYEILGINKKNYIIEFIITKANIFSKKVELKVIADDKIYDGTTSTLLRFAEEYDVLSYDSNYIDKNIGNKKRILVKNIILKDKNYYVDDLVLLGNIIPKMIDFIYYPKSKIYDGTTYCDGSYTTTKCLDDDVECLFNAEFKDINSGIEIEVLISNIKLIGNDSNNYKLNSVKSLNESITKKEITCTFKNVDKMYDKLTLGFVQIDKIYGLIQTSKNDNIQIVSLDAHYEDPFIGNNKNIIIKNIELEPMLFNYFIKDTFCVGNIMLRELNIVFNNPIKIYDGLLDVVLSINNIKNILNNDQVYVKSVKGTFSDSNVGKNKLVYVTDIELDDYTSKYYYCKETKIEGTIKEKFLKIDFIAKDQEYEPNLIPEVYYELDDPLLEIISYNASYYIIDVGLQKILISNIILGGKNIRNYIVADHITYGNILPKNKNLEFKFNDKIYDGTTTTNVICITDNTITFDANYESPNIGHQKIIINNIIQTTTKYMIKNEYILDSKILAKELQIKPEIIKNYDGTTDYNLVNIPEIESCNCKFSISDVGTDIPIFIYNIVLKNSNYFINDFKTTGTIIPKEINCEFIPSDKIYDGTNKVFFDKIYCDITILSFDSYYENINVGYKNIIVKNIKLENNNYYCNSLVISSTIKPKLLEIEFIVNSKIYDKTDIAVINSYKLLNINQKIKLYSYTAKYENNNIGKQLVIISNLIIDTQNYYTDKYYTYGIINPRNVIINFTNTTKEYDSNVSANISLLSFENKILDDNLELIYFNSEYEDTSVNKNKNIIINNIKVEGKDINNYIYNNTIIIKGTIEPKIIDCEFKLINNSIVGKLLGLLNNDNVWIANYISYKKNNNYYIENIIIDGFNQNNYILPNKIYTVL
jgi:hypothetical protein